MEKIEKIEFSSDDYVVYRGSIVGVAIVCALTGVFCTVQAGGKACAHPKCEGYTLPILMEDDKDINAINKFDDCEWGCWNYDFEEEHLKKYSENIESLLNEHVNNNISKLKFSFDNERISELKEGWWPVFIQFTEWGYGGKTYPKKFKGYLHFGNCD